MNIERAYSFNSLAAGDIIYLDKITWPNGSTAATISTTVGRGGTRSLQIGETAMGPQIALSTTLSHIGVGMAVQFNGTAFDNRAFLSFRDAGTVQVYVKKLVNRTFQVLRGDNTVLATTVGIFDAMDHFYIRVVIDNSAGVIELRKNGVLDQAILTGLDTQQTANATVNTVNLYDHTAGNNGQIMWYDDVYVANALDSDTTFPGDIHFKTRTPTGAGDSTQWIPSTGANWQNVDETTQNADTDYNQVSGSMLDDLFSGDSVVGGGAVRCVVVNSWLKKPSGGTPIVHGIAKVGGTIYSGTVDHVPTTEYKMYHAIFDENVALMTVADANAAQFGVRKVV